MQFRSSDENSCIFSHRNIYRRVQKNRNVTFFQYRAALFYSHIGDLDLGEFYAIQYTGPAITA